MKGTGLDKNVAAALSYVLGFVSGIIFLLIEKEDKFVRFHATQSTITFLGLFIIQQLVSRMFFGFLFLLPFIFVIELILWIVLIVKAYQGEEFELPVIGPIAKQQINKK